MRLWPGAPRGISRALIASTYFFFFYAGYLENAKCLNKYKRQTERKCGKLFEFKLTKEHCT